MTIVEDMNNQPTDEILFEVVFIDRTNLHYGNYEVYGGSWEYEQATTECLKLQRLFPRYKFEIRALNAAAQRRVSK